MSTRSGTQDLLRRLPKVDALLQEPRLAGFPRGVAVAAARRVLARLRASLQGGLTDLPDDLVARVETEAALLRRGRIRPVLNATGVVVHTNLGRSPWPDSAREGALQAMGYCNVEVDLATGKRGGRMDGLRSLVQALTGAEDALVVNNCAAAVLLALTALARDREVIVSRGELVEIGGSFRVPEVIASGGARLREVGTTNRTRLADYEAAIGPDTAVLLRVHPSNFRVVGFTEAASRAELVDLGRRAGVPVLEDLGSGSLDGLRGEPSIREAVAEGVDLALFSGDKLLGGPQAGVIVGQRASVERLRRHPLYRALRVDKVILAALERTLGDHLAGVLPPTLQMLTLGPEALGARADRLRDLLEAGGVSCAVGEDVGRVGGGALPGVALPGPVVRVRAGDVEELARRLRLGEPAVVARISDGALVLDPRTLAEEDLPRVASRVIDALGTMGT